MKAYQLVLCLAVTAVLAGCNTFAGAGKDIERGGEVVQEAARDVQKKL
ncbi:entericidin A/B family lipoprotein [Oceanimonas baumannii]|uniref:Entericidin n=1 Tax=Oceanimonas baumannii TaxID=129578 RepID=A0A235CMK6_9GAMM|nr:entericidin A/B family lipoprotein [Oceanimonas baumannii]OYD25801.1 entericidin [Oceanimonas baumannii]TDW60187.1 putative small secreted protein [Oceanimonas baumannii]